MNKKLTKGDVITVIIVLLIIGVILWWNWPTTSTSSTGTGSSKTVACKVCGRTFDRGTSDSRKINSTGMCTNCYNNYKSAQQAVGKN